MFYGVTVTFWFKVRIRFFRRCFHQNSVPLTYNAKVGDEYNQIRPYDGFPQILGLCMIDPDIQSRSPHGLLMLLALPGVGRHTAEKLAVQFDTIGAIHCAVESDLRSIVPSRALKTVLSNNSWEKADEDARQVLDSSRSHSVRIISRFDPEFPCLLTRIPDPPLLLHIKGRLRQEKLVAAVGTRSPSTFGIKVAQRITKFIAERNWGIVSGLAIGIDTECHRAALNANGYTVAVLANGLDSVYPASNKKLADEILASGGALVAEQPIGAKAFAQNLIQRDRVQSGLSVATFVMQTDIVGGSMHTVRFTLLQHRQLFVPIPTKLYRDEPKSQGIIALAEQSGSKLASILSAEDSYLFLLRTTFAGSPPAYGIRGAEDYEHVLELLGRPVPPNIAPINEASQKELFT